MEKSSKKRGRPPVTTAADLQDAALELFMTMGYENTNSAMIANVAGTSRATFFNYYKVKSDVFWLETDTAISTFRTSLLSAHATPETALTLILQSATSALTAWHAEIPWVFNNYELIGSPAAVQESAGTRVAAIQSIFNDFLQGINELDSDLLTDVLAAQLAATIATVVSAWATAGSLRGDLNHDLKAALTRLAKAYPELGDLK